MQTARRVSDFPDSGVRTCGTTLGATRILKFAGEPLTFAPAAGRRNEDPIGEEHRRQQRAEPLQQLPTCTHIAFLEFSGGISLPETACYSLCQRQTSSNPRSNG